jgi:hypothetical protein
MGPMSEVETTEAECAGGPDHFACDFCGEEVTRVRRIALDRDYDRLQKPHPVQYACDRCSEEKERQRLELAGG